jgi:thioredoxin reductase
MTTPYETIIIGAGPAGLSAALVLGCCRRRVLLIDSGRYRNERSTALHCFMGCDGIAPAELLERSPTQLTRSAAEHPPAPAVRSPGVPRRLGCLHPGG